MRRGTAFLLLASLLAHVLGLRPMAGRRPAIRPRPTIPQSTWIRPTRVVLDRRKLAGATLRAWPQPIVNELRRSLLY
jgi:hypothetical protein